MSGRATVIDGDTIGIRDTRIRLFGIDAPEGGQSCLMPSGRAWRCGQRAALALADRIGAGTVRRRVLDRDRYGRSVVRCFAGSEDIGAWMVRNGWALAYRAYATDYVDEEAAATEGAGMWAGSFVAPWDLRCGDRVAPQAPAVPDPPYADRDCADFATRAAAQAFFRSAGPGDPHRLDQDGDGIAFEVLPQ